MTITHEAAKSLAWIVEFCNEHPEWFGEDTPDDGAEYEWLANARKFLTRYNGALATKEEIAAATVFAQ